MPRIKIMAVALALPLLTGCAGAYVAGDAGAHRDNLSLETRPAGGSDMAALSQTPPRRFSPGS